MPFTSPFHLLKVFSNKLMRNPSSNFGLCEGVMSFLLIFSRACFPSLELFVQLTWPPASVTKRTSPRIPQYLNRWFSTGSKTIVLPPRAMALGMHHLPTSKHKQNRHAHLTKRRGMHWAWILQSLLTLIAYWKKKINWGLVNSAYVQRRQNKSLVIQKP